MVDQYVLNGYRLFSTKNKKPLRKGWTRTEFDPLLCAGDLAEQFAVCLQDDDLILDVDPRRYKDNVNQLDTLLQQYPGLLDTFVVRSQSGGMHIYFKKPAHVSVRSVVPGFPAIEVKHKGNYVIGAGSPNYEVQHGRLDNVQQCPDELLAFVTETRSRGTGAIATDDEATKCRFIDYINRHPGATVGQAGDVETFKVACEGREYGLSEAVVLEIMLHYFNPKCFRDGEANSWTQEKLTTKVRNAFNYAKREQGNANALADFANDRGLLSELEANDAGAIRFQRTKKDEIKPNLANAVQFFNVPASPLYKLVRYNNFAEAIELTAETPWDRPPENQWGDTDTVMLRLHFNNRFGLEFTPSTVYEAVVASAQLNRYNPLQDWLNSLIWDGKPRIDRLFPHYCGSPDSPYHRAIGKNTLLAACARAFEPGCQHDYMTVLEGAQGIGKGRFIKALAGKWYASVRINPDRIADTVQAMLGSWILEAPEMEFIRRSDLMALKGFLTDTVDKVRMPYGRFTSQYRRQSIFMSTVNPDDSGEYLKDRTGNRRYWVVACRGMIKLQELEADRDQIFAEAMHRYRAGEQRYLTDDLEADARGEQLKRQQSDPWDDIILNWLTGFDVSNVELTTELIALNALSLPAGKIDRSAQIRIATAMKSAGYSQTRFRSDHGRVRVWGVDSILD
jgi:predicted P-loop ATPase